MKKRVGVVLIAHGSKRSESNEEFMQLCEEIRLENILDFDEISCAFLEFQTPSLEIAIELMHNKDINEVYIYPYFLNSGKHVLVDLPEIISQAQEKHTEMNIQLLTHFGASPSITAIIANDLKTIFLA